MKTQNSKNENSKFKKWKFKKWKLKIQNSKSENSKIENTKIKFQKWHVWVVCVMCVMCVSCVPCVSCVWHVCCVCDMCVSCSTVTLDPLAADDNDSNDCKWSTPQSLLLHVVSERDDTDDGDPMTTTISYRSHSLHWPHRESLTQTQYLHWLTGDHWCCVRTRTFKPPVNVKLIRTPMCGSRRNGTCRWYVDLWLQLKWRMLNSSSFSVYHRLTCD